MKDIGIGILGGTGVGAGELLRLLANHPNAKVVSVVSRSQAKKNLSLSHSHLNGFYNLSFDSELNYEELKKYDKKIIFCALPHGVSAEKIVEIESQNLDNLKIIDLSGDFRIKNEKIHREFYETSKYLPELRNQFVYGLSEKNKEDIINAKFIANPGCYATASILSVLPIINKEIEGEIIFDGKSGTSGGGRSLSEMFHHPYRNANMQAYKMLEHRHEPEIQEGLDDKDFSRLKLKFVPHLIPISRGMIVTSYLSLKEEISTDDLIEIYNNFYKDSCFVRISKNSPELRNVVGGNFCDISITGRKNQVVVVSCIDNLVKGMAGQAIQNMNLMSGLEETTGLNFAGLGLV